MLLLCAWVSLLLAPFTAGATEISLSIADITAPDFSARGIMLILPEDGSADLRITELNIQQRAYATCISIARLHLSTQA